MRLLLLFGLNALLALLSWRFRSPLLQRLIPGDPTAPWVKDPGAFVRYAWLLACLVFALQLLRWAWTLDLGA